MPVNIAKSRRKKETRNIGAPLGLAAWILSDVNRPEPVVDDDRHVRALVGS
jgi:hypothetical protein